MSDDTLTYEPNPEATEPASPFGTFAEDGTYTPRQITDDDLGGSFGDAIDGTMVSVEDGQLVEGTVVKVDRDEVLLDIGYKVGSSRVDLQACKLEYSIVSPK